MVDVLAVGWGSLPPPVRITAGALAAIHGTAVREMVVPSAGRTSEAVDAVLAVSAHRAVLLVVAAPGSPDAPVWRIVSRCPTPAVLVPAHLTEVPARIRRALVPLDGTAEAAAAVRGTVALLAGSGVQIVVQHVVVPATVPRYWDQPAHAQQVWEDEFLARFCSTPGVRIRLRRGVPSEDVLELAQEEGVDLIALGWAQRLGGGRARIVRHAVSAAPVPVLLVPVGAGQEDLGPYSARAPFGGIRL